MRKIHKVHVDVTDRNSLAHERGGVWDCYTKGGTFGSGHDGSVCSARPRGENQKEVAIKQYWSDRELARFDREVRMLQRVQGHNHVVRFLDLFRASRAFVMELCPEGDLMTRLDQREQRPVTEVELKSWSKQILAGVEHIHARHVGHGDLKPENLLVVNGCLKLTDFSSSFFFRTACSSKQTGVMGKSTAAYTLGYVAPEQLARRYDERVDLWAVGIVLYAAFFGIFPFEHTQNPNDLANSDAQIRFDHVPGICLSTSAQGLIRGLVRHDANQRTSVVAALQSSWFQASVGEASSAKAPMFRRLDSTSFSASVAVPYTSDMMDIDDDGEKLPTHLTHLDTQKSGFEFDEDL